MPVSGPFQARFVASIDGSGQGCQMVYFQTKNTNLGKFRSDLQRKVLLNFKVIWSNSLPFGILVYIHILWPFWYILWPFWYIFHILVGCTKKNLATLEVGPPTRRSTFGLTSSQADIDISPTGKEGVEARYLKPQVRH
jgi:hypothetical protein